MIEKIVKNLLYLSICTVLLASCSNPEKEKQAHYEKAMNLVKQEKTEAAILELKTAIQKDAKFSNARYQLGLLYLRKGEVGPAYGELVRAADLDPDNFDANLKVAQFLLLSRKKEEARKRVESVLAKDARHRDALALLANIELIEGNFEKALSALDRIGEEKDKSDELLNIRGRIYAAQRQWDKAEEYFRAAMGLNPKFGNYEMLLRLLEEKKDKEATKKLLDEIAIKFPDVAKTHLLLAGYYQSTGKPELVAQELEKVVELEPQDPRHRLQLYEFYRKENRNKAEETLQKAHAELAKDPDISVALASYYFDRGKFPEAQALLDELKASAPGHGGAEVLAARFLLREGKAQDAAARLKKLTEDYPEWAPPYFYLGMTHYSLGEIGLAQQDVTTAIQKNGQIAEYHTFLAQIYQNQGMLKEAQGEAAMGLRLDSHNLRAAVILGRLFVEGKQFKEANALLADLNRQVPGNPEILTNLAAACLGAGDRKTGEQTLVELLGLDPGNIPAMTMFIDLQFKNDGKKAEGFIRNQIAKAPQDARPYMMLGLVLEQQKDRAGALAAYEKAIELNPELSSPYFSAAKLLTLLGRKDEAMAKYTAMVEKHPEVIAGRMGRAALWQADGNVKEAKEEYRKILGIKRNYTPAANNLAWLIASDPEGDLGEALMLAMTAKQEFPGDPHVADTLGWVHYRRNSFSLAQTQFELAVKSQPDNPSWNYHLALAQKGNNKKAAAIETLKKLLARKDQFSERKQAEELLAELSRE